MSRRRRKTASEKRLPRSRQWRIWAIVLSVMAALLLLAFFARSLSSGPRLRARAVEAQSAGDWPAAFTSWNAYNRADTRADVESLLQEARAGLLIHQAVPARLALERAVGKQPTDPRAWVLLLELLRLEDRPLEVIQLGEEALAAVTPSRKTEILSATTLALLSEVPEAEARQTLEARIEANPADLDAQAALLRRIAANPSADDPSRPQRVDRLQILLDQNPAHVGVREALVSELADAGEPVTGREALSGWPAEAQNDARYLRLKGRWALEYDKNPAQAVSLLSAALEQLPHDGPSRYRLARALKASGQLERANQEARRLALLREALDPRRLTRRLETNLKAVSTSDSPAARADLALLGRQVGLYRLSQAWETAR